MSRESQSQSLGNDEEPRTDCVRRTGGNRVRCGRDGGAQRVLRRVRTGEPVSAQVGVWIVRARAAKRLVKIQRRLGGAKTREDVRTLVARDHASAASAAGGARAKDGDGGGNADARATDGPGVAAAAAGVGDARTVDALLPDMARPDAFTFATLRPPTA